MKRISPEAAKVFELSGLGCLNRPKIEQFRKLAVNDVKIKL